MKHVLSYTIIGILSLGLLYSVAADTPSKTSDYEAASSLSRVFRDASKKVLPATVKVISHTRARTNADDEKGAFRFFSPDSRMPGDGMGTGVIVDPKGILLTNYHVIKDAKEVEIELYDGHKIPVKRIRFDERSDLAVLWVTASDPLPYAKFGRSDTLDIGDWVLAIGNPFDLDSSVSAGIISAKGRSISRVSRGDMLQTDAAINPGNSGGPLINLDGEIVGINTAIASQSGGYQGIGFAIPSENAQWIMSQLIEKGNVQRAWLGVAPQAVSAEIAQKLGVAPRTGVMIDMFVGRNSPADNAKLEREDIILAVDETPVNSPSELQQAIERCDISKPHKLKIIRNKKQIDVEVQLETMSDDADASRPLIGERARPVSDRSLGLSMLVLTPEMANKLSLRNKEGLVIVDVNPGSLAERAGLEKGMLIEKVNGKTVKSAEDYNAARKDGSLSDGIKFDTFLKGEKNELSIKVG